MAYEIGSIVEGKVTEITRFGAFIALPDGKSGMVHISEVASTFVKEIRDFLAENQEVRAKVISINKDGKIGLSIKRVNEDNNKADQNEYRSAHQRKPRINSDPYIWTPKRPAEPVSFEDKLNKFKLDSSERMLSSKQYADPKKRINRRAYQQNNQK